MPTVVAAYRTYKNDDGKTVTEKHMMLSVHAREVVRNGQGEWSTSPPKDASAVIDKSEESKQALTESETRPERRGQRSRSKDAAAEE